MATARGAPGGRRRGEPRDVAPDRQHLLRLLNARGRGLSAAEYLWVRNATLLAAIEAMCLVLDDADFTATGPNEGDWSAAQVLEHVVKAERGYRERIVAGLAAAKGDAGAAEAGGRAGA